MKNSDVEVIKYILDKLQHKTTLNRLYGIMYLSQKEYLSKYGKAIFDDRFHLSGKFLKPLQFNDFILPNSEFNTYYDEKETYDKFIECNNKPDLDYIAEMEKKTINKVCEICEKMSDKEIMEQCKDFAYIKAKNRMTQDPDLSVITDVDMAKAGGGSSDLVKYLVDNKLIKTILG